MGIPTIKPWNKELVLEKLDFVNDHNIFAVAMDVDGAGLPFLKALNPNAGSKSVEEMREIIDHAKMPFVIKGIMTPKGALKAVEAGADAIVVSNHGGRVQGNVPSTAEVLPGIAKAVKGNAISHSGSKSRLRSLLTAASGAALMCSRPLRWALTLF